MTRSGAFPPVTLGRIDVLTCCGLIGLTLLIGALRIVPRVVGVVHDDGVYVSSAQALAEGKGYRLPSLPGEPRQTKYPILYPALLAVVWKLWPEFPANVVAMKWLTLLAASASVGIAYLFLVRFGYASRASAAAGAGLGASVPMFSFLSTLTMSEGVFGLLVVSALWRVQSVLARDRPGPAWRQLGTGVAIALPFLCRGFGLAILAGALVTLARAGRPLRWVLSGCLPLVAAWFVWALPGPSSEVSVVTGYYTDYRESIAATFGPHGLRIVGLNVVLIVTSTVGMAFGGLRRIGEPAALVAVLFFLGLGAATWWFIVGEARRGALLPACLTFYAFLATVWPWPSPRFLVPVLPLLVPLVCAAAARMMGRIGPRFRGAVRLAGFAVIGVALASHATLLVQLMLVSREARYPYDSGSVGFADRPASWAAYEDVFSWIRSNTRPEDVIACGLDTMVYLYTGRTSFRPAMFRPEVAYGVETSPIGTPTELRGVLEHGRARYLVLLPGYSDGRALQHVLAQIQQDEPGFVETVHTGRDARFVVMKIGPVSPSRSP